MEGKQPRLSEREAGEGGGEMTRGFHAVRLQQSAAKSRLRTH